MLHNNTITCFVCAESSRAAEQQRASQLRELEQDDSVYHVKKIVSGEKRGRTRYFLIKWEGYPEEENTWEPERNLLGASVKRMVATYKKANQMK
uniref:Chromo domain-containing protein n=1 Tax=Chromera velia CCMP2878 TaxID=1169474 RepID=A0A0G4HGI7_9ALVE|eukprot:Cvel_27238.t1-p1 / transcript=Cvel_27238.t1 / gene=Cvel_27238 / organism=Chromera_velia_CCMP2878 / gene_product=Heterochromatin protein 1, putative / transcript_product=Heterochromatin protein 1, putative / location=Cvel_scaffold3372:12089-12367(-) / protein_length=93 / sequence_SO=supercontig / SO=protein_coding / is_pseudo=false